MKKVCFSCDFFNTFFENAFFDIPVFYGGFCYGCIFIYNVGTLFGCGEEPKKQDTGVIDTDTTEPVEICDDE